MPNGQVQGSHPTATFTSTPRWIGSVGWYGITAVNVVQPSRNIAALHVLVGILKLVLHKVNLIPQDAADATKSLDELRPFL
mmetsp:Transcript_38066/g.94613  ORF Transcript_38066/g.94613 Transcript_38066/m.94613 type:complete len:81 (-) Transcript_38066:1454-1696(-)